MTPNGQQPNTEPNTTEGRVSRIGVSYPVFYSGQGIMLIDVTPAFKAIVRADDGRELDVTDQLGEMVALGLDNLGFETGIADDDPVQVAEVYFENWSADDRFYVINVMQRTAEEIDPHTIQRCLAAAVKKLLEEMIAEERDSGETQAESAEQG